MVEIFSYWIVSHERLATTICMLLYFIIIKLKCKNPSLQLEVSRFGSKLCFQFITKLFPTLILSVYRTNVQFCLFIKLVCISIGTTRIQPEKEITSRFYWVISFKRQLKKEYILSAFTVKSKPIFMPIVILSEQKFLNKFFISYSQIGEEL